LQYKVYSYIIKEYNINYRYVKDILSDAVISIGFGEKQAE